MSTDPMALGVTAVMLPEIDFQEQLRLCRTLGVTHYSWRPRIIATDQRDKPYNPWGRHAFDLTPQRLLAEAPALRRMLDDAGLVSFGTLPSASTALGADELKLHFEGAAAVGAGRVRVAPAAYPDGHFDYESLLDRTIQRYREVVALARPYGLKIVIETHCRSLASSPALALNICRAFEPAELGVIFDINNYMIEGGLRPNLAVAVLAPYIDHCHVGGARLRADRTRDSLGFLVPAFDMCSLADADQNIPQWLGALHAAGVAAPLVIENFATHAPGAQRLAESVAQLRKVFASLA